MTASPCLTATMRRMECVQSSARAGTCILSGFQLYTPKHPTMFGHPSPPHPLSVAFWILRLLIHPSVRICLFIRVFNMPFACTRVYKFMFDRETAQKLAGIKSSFNLGNRTGYFAMIVRITPGVRSTALMRFVIMSSHLCKLHLVQISARVN